MKKRFVVQGLFVLTVVAGLLLAYVEGNRLRWLYLSLTGGDLDRELLQALEDKDE
ncbi:MAG: hypothetical protein AAF517_15670 [Planctomycetota bacterium]